MSLPPPAHVSRPQETRCGNRTLRWGSRTYVVGILNMTPDSFSGDGIGGDVRRAVAQAERFVEQGADIIDIGGSRPDPAQTQSRCKKNLTAFSLQSRRSIAR